jgi:hypothetical protein
MGGRRRGGGAGHLPDGVHPRLFAPGKHRAVGGGGRGGVALVAAEEAQQPHVADLARPPQRSPAGVGCTPLGTATAVAMR